MEKEEIQKFHEYLTDNLGLSANQAFEVIYYLQSTLPLIPDNFEMCGECKNMYDADYGGCFSETEQKFYCSWCDNGDID